MENGTTISLVRQPHHLVAAVYFHVGALVLDHTYHQWFTEGIEWAFSRSGYRGRWRRVETIKREAGGASKGLPRST